MKRSVDGKRNGDSHQVPLPTLAVDILRRLHPLTRLGKLLFHGERSHDRPISDNTLRAALMTLGYGPDVQSVHGFLATARTLLAEELNMDPLVIETQLAHAVKDANGRAYNRTQYMILLGLHAIVDGLPHNWLPEATAFDLPNVGTRVIDTHLRGLGFKLSQEPDRRIDPSAFRAPWTGYGGHFCAPESEHCCRKIRPRRLAASIRRTQQR